MTINDGAQVQDVVFVSHVQRIKARGTVKVQLFVEDQARPVGTIKLDGFDALADNPTLTDRAFQRWVTNGFFHQTVEDPALLSILEIAQAERLAGMVWYRIAHRFLLAEGSTHERPRFVFTTDKSDLPDREKRILKVGEEVVQREEVEQEEARRLRAKEEEDRKENLRAKHSQLILTVAKEAISENSVPVDRIRRLSQLGLLDRSTSFRSGARFPGESNMLRFEFEEEGERHSGILGFDSSNTLLSIDERHPVNRQLYRKGTADIPKWTEYTQDR